jgi:hypothetical protein
MQCIHEVVEVINEEKVMFDKVFAHFNDDLNAFELSIKYN